MGCKKPAQDLFMIAKCFPNRLPQVESGICKFDSCHRANKLMNPPWTKSKMSTLLVSTKRSLSHFRGNRWLTEGQERVPWRTCRWLQFHFTRRRLQGYPLLQEIGGRFSCWFIEGYVLKRRHEAAVGEKPVSSASLMHNVGVGTARDKTRVQSSYHNKQRTGDWKPRQWKRRILWFLSTLPPGCH